MGILGSSTIVFKVADSETFAPARGAKHFKYFEDQNFRWKKNWVRGEILKHF